MALQLPEVIMRKNANDGSGEPRPVDERGVAELVENHHVILAEQPA